MTKMILLTLAIAACGNSAPDDGKPDPALFADAVCGSDWDGPASEGGVEGKRCDAACVPRIQAPVPPLPQCEGKSSTGHKARCNGNAFAIDGEVGCCWRTSAFGSPEQDFGKGPLVGDGLFFAVCE